MDKKSLYAIYDIGALDSDKGKTRVGTSFGRFNKACSDVNGFNGWAEREDTTCMNNCKDGQDHCKQAAKALQILPCSPKPTPQPTPQPTAPPPTPSPSPAPTKESGGETPSPTASPTSCKTKAAYDERVQNTFNSKECTKVGGKWKSG